MASLSSQISGMSSTQKSRLSAKLKPMIGPLTSMLPFAAPLISTFVNAAPGALAMAIKPVEGMLPAQAKSMIQSAITQAIGSPTKAPTTTTRGPIPTRLRAPTWRTPTKTPIAVDSGGAIYTPPQPWYASTGAKVGLAIAGVGIGFAVFKKLKK